MAKFLSVIFLFVGCSPTAFSQSNSDSVRMNIAILDTAKSDKVSVVVEIKNLSPDTKKMLKHGRVDYVNGKIKPLGNYIVEVQRLEKEAYVPFPPTADIDPVFESEQWEIKPNGYLMETIKMNGRSWNSKGFPKGQYRVRIAFNWDERSSSLKNVSRWVAFTIQ